METGQKSGIWLAALLCALLPLHAAADVEAPAPRAGEVHAVTAGRVPQGVTGPEVRADSMGLALADTYSGGLATFQSPPMRTPLPFTAIGAHWLAETPRGTRIELYLSTSADGYTWTRYARIATDPHLTPTRLLPNAKPNPNFGERLGQLFFRVRGDGRFLRYRVVLSRDAKVTATPRLRRLAFSVIDSRSPAVADHRVPARPAAPVALGQAYPKPYVAGRAEWGAMPPACGYTYCATTHVAIHHTAGVGDYACSGFDECATVVRAVQAFHMNTNGWCDVGYNFLATADGTLWEGRGGGDDVRGAHDGFNCGSMGVANVGYFHPPFNQLWTEAQQDAVAELAAWKSHAEGIDPFGADYYSGFGALMDNVYGHRDVSATACPGDNIHALLPALRSRVNDRLNNGPQAWIFDNPAAAVIGGNWATGTSSGDKFGSDYLWTSTGSGQICAWRVDVATPGLYDVAVWWPAGANRNPQTQVFVKRRGPTPVLVVDQQTAGGQWNSIGAFSLPRGNVDIGVTNQGTAGRVVICDAIRLQPLH